MVHPTLILSILFRRRRLVEWHLAHDVKTCLALRHYCNGMLVPNLAKLIAISLMPMSGMMECVILIRESFRVLFGLSDYNLALIS